MSIFEVRTAPSNILSYPKLIKEFSKLLSIIAVKNCALDTNDIIENKSVQEKISVFIKNHSDNINPSRTTVIDYISWVKKYVK